MLAAKEVTAVTHHGLIREELANSSKSLWISMSDHEKRTLMKTVCLNQKIDP